MTWLKFLTCVFVVYSLYYGVTIVMDILKGGPSAKLAPGEGEIINISDIEEDHQPQIIQNEISAQSQNSSPAVPAVVYEPAQEEETDNLAGIIAPVVSKGFDLKELAEQFKAGAIQTTRDIAFK